MILDGKAEAGGAGFDLAIAAVWPPVLTDCEQGAAIGRIRMLEYLEPEMSVEQLSIRHGNEAVRVASILEREFTMIRTRTTGVILAAVCAFVASSLWYGPILFGRQFLALSAMVAGSQPIAGKVALEMVRNLLLASALPGS